MGGMGSGTWIRWDTREKVENQRAINVSRWNKQGFFKPGASWKVHWLVDGKSDGSIRVRFAENKVILSYRYRFKEQAWECVEEVVLLSRTNCHYGGSRPWFLCPECERRVMYLYDAGRLFLCRHCYQLSYESQCLAPVFRGIQKAQKIRKRLRGDTSLLGPLPKRPKGMHWRTYSQLVDKEYEAECEAVKRMPGYLGVSMDW